MINVKGKESILIVSPHPDDETLGAGGYLLKQKNSGADIHWLNMTHMSEDCGYTQNDIQKRDKEVENVCAFYGFNSFNNLSYSPSSLDRVSLNEMISKISDIVSKIQPSILILPNPSDAHSDHLYTYKACFPLTKIFRYPSIRKVLCMEILSETDFGGHVFEPNYFVDISNHMDKKIEIMKCYKSELREHPFPRSVEAIKSLAVLRGSIAGCQYAEAFKIMKWID